MPESESAFRPHSAERENNNILLQAPEDIRPEDITLGDQESSFSSNDDKRKYIIGNKDGESYFIIEFYESLPDGLSPDEKVKFTHEKRTINGVETDVYEYSYGQVRERSAAEKEEGTNFPPEYHIEPPRKLTNYELDSSQHLTPQQLAEIIKNKKTIFYTGAGISMDSGMPNLDQWEESMGINRAQETDEFLRQAMRDPAKNLAPYNDFRNKAATLPATPAHHALAKIAKETNSQILTDNSDQLHERAGTKAIHVTGEWFRDHIEPEQLKEIDAVVVVGFNKDDRGFLAWYKKHNPNGKIIAINKKQPEYIGEGDAFIKGDVQQILPKIEHNLE